MERQRRWSALLEGLAESGRVDIEGAAERLGVSTATVRRDLDELAAQHLLVRTRGGAMPHSVAYELPLRYKSAQRAEEKRAIAAAVAELVAAEAVVGLNGGTTTTEVARALAARATRPGLTVVTNAVNIAHELAVRDHVKLVLTGGVARPQSYELIGPLATLVLAEIALDIAVLGVDGVSVDEGACTNHEGEAAISRLIAGRARQVVVAADSTKLGRHAFARVCALTEIDILVTDTGAPPDAVAALEDAGTRVVLAAP